MITSFYWSARSINPAWLEITLEALDQMLLFIGVTGVIQHRGRTLTTLGLTFKRSHDCLNDHELMLAHAIQHGGRTTEGGW